MLSVLFVVIGALSDLASDNAKTTGSDAPNSDEKPLEIDGSRTGLGRFTFAWEGKRLDLSKGLYIVAMLSDSCPDCAELVSGLNEMAQDEELPPIVSFVLGDTASLQTFQEKYRPEFPTRMMGAMEYLGYIGKAPPRFILLRNGEQVQYWDETLPEAFAFAEAALSAM